MADSPALIVYKGIWGILGDCSGSGVVVKAGNLIDYTTIKADKGNHQVADLPEVKGVLSGDRYDPDGTSSSTVGLIQTFEFVVNTADLSPEKQTALKWYIFKKVWAWTRDGSTQFQYLGESFCQKLAYQTSFEGQRIAEGKALPKGWSSVIAIDAYMTFSRTQMGVT